MKKKWCFSRKQAFGYYLKSGHAKNDSSPKAEVYFSREFVKCKLRHLNMQFSCNLGEKRPNLPENNFWQAFRESRI